MWQGGEYISNPSTACNLASINIYKFLNDDKTFDTEEYIHAVHLWQMALEASVNYGAYPTYEIARKSHMLRSTGLGIANLASIFMSSGYPYDSEEARNYGAVLVSLLTATAYKTSALMSKKTSPFEWYNINKDTMKRVLRNQAIASGVIDEDMVGIDYDVQMIKKDVADKIGINYIYEYLKDNWNKALEYGDKYAYKNCFVSCVAPTGTIALGMSCANTSIEPSFAHIVYKKLTGGAYMQFVDDIVEVGLDNLGYTKEQIKDISEYMLANGGNMEDAPHIKDEHLPIFDTANKNGEGKRYISPMGHVKMLTALTPFVSGSISKTINVPEEATVQDIKDVYYNSWKMGAKGITVYRDNSKASAPLSNKKEDETKSSDLDSMKYKELLEYAKNKTEEASAPKLQRKKINGIRNGRTHYGKIEDVKIYVTVNRDSEDNISEIYITSDKVGSTITGLLNSLSKTISTMLQYQIAPKDISRMYRGASYTPSGFVMGHDYIKNCSSISDFVSKVIDIELGDYRFCQVKPEGWEDKKPKITLSNNLKPKEISHLEDLKNDEDAEVIHKTCPECGGDKFIKAGSCSYCLSCGTSDGCS